MPLERVHTHDELMEAEKEAASNPDVNTPAQDDEWNILEQRLGQRKLAEDERGRCAQVIQLQKTG